MVWGFILLVLFILPACAQKYGYIQENETVLDLYASKMPLPDYDYYYTGRSNLPYAVIGVDKKYTFNDRVWIKIDSKEEVYDKIAHLDDRPGTGVYNDITGADIVNKSEGKLGIWFSYYAYTIVKVDPDTKMLDVFNPYSPSGSFGDAPT